MRRGTALVLICCNLSLYLGVVSCRKITTPADLAPVQLKTEPLQLQDAVPLDYGTLVGVTSSYQGSAQLWFEKADKTIVVVSVNLDSRRMSASTLVIPRR
jgi:hypothetical protein